MKRVLIIGSGWAGASASYLLEKNGISTTIFEKNNVVGGHSRSEILNNIIYEPNGPHIFHTSIERVNKFVVEFGMSRNFKHKIKSRIYPDSLNGESLLVSWPPQVSELKKLKEWKKIESELENLPKNPKDENFETYAISIMGQTLYELFIYGYTKKQWDLEPSNLSSNFAPKRIDLRYDNNKAIFKDKWEYFHPEGSGKVIENILKNKEVILNQKINENLKNEIIKESKFPTFFCGRLANYTYINQDQAIEQGFQCAEEIIRFLR